MKRNLDQQINSLDSKAFQISDQSDDTLTLKHMCFMAVTAQLQGDEKLQIDTKMKLYSLAKRLHDGGEVDLASEDISLIKERLARMPWNVVAFGRAVDLLEGADDE